MAVPSTPKRPKRPALPGGAELPDPSSASHESGVRVSSRHRLARRLYFELQSLAFGYAQFVGWRSAETAERDYGVVIVAGDHVDAAATESARAARRTRAP